jgi:hypothetical protein
MTGVFIRAEETDNKTKPYEGESYGKKETEIGIIQAKKRQ